VSDRKQSYLEEAVEKLARVRDTQAAVLPYTNKALEQQLARLSADMLHGLCDALDLLRDRLREQDEALFEAYQEWMLEDAGGEALAAAITARPGYAEWSAKVTRGAEA
jgi:hypothetical protein